MEQKQEKTQTTDQETVIFGLARLLASYRKLKSENEKSAKGINAKIAEINRELADHMVTENLGKFSLDGNLFYTAVQSFTKIEDEARLFAFLRAHDEEAMIKETVNNQTLRAWYKETGSELFEEELKDGILDIHEEVQVRIRSDKSTQ